MKKVVYSGITALALLTVFSSCGKKDEGAPAPAAVATPVPSPTPDNASADYKNGFENGSGPTKEAIKNASIRIVNDDSGGTNFNCVGTNCNVAVPARNQVRVSSDSPIQGYFNGPRPQHALEVQLRFDNVGRLHATIIHDQVTYHARNISYEYTHPADVADYRPKGDIRIEDVNLKIGGFQAVVAGDPSQSVNISNILASQDASTVAFGGVSERKLSDLNKRLDKEKNEAAERELRKKEKEMGVATNKDEKTPPAQEAKPDAAKTETKATPKPRPLYPLVFDIVNEMFDENGRGIRVDVSQVVAPVNVPAAPPAASLPPGTKVYSGTPSISVNHETVLFPAQLQPL